MSPDNAFVQAQQIEQEAWEVYLKPFFRCHAANGELVTLDKGRAARRLQLTAGDLVLNSAHTGETLTIECKTERRWTENLFLETWSNRPRLRRGWLDHLRDCSTLAYFFLDVEILYICDFEALRNWAFKLHPREKGFYEYPERRQGVYTQMNETWGRVVKIDDLFGMPAIKLRAFDLGPGGGVSVGRHVSYQLATGRKEHR